MIIEEEGSFQIVNQERIVLDEVEIIEGYIQQICMHTRMEFVLGY